MEKSLSTDQAALACPKCQSGNFVKTCRDEASRYAPELFARTYHCCCCGHDFTLILNGSESPNAKQPMRDFAGST